MFYTKSNIILNNPILFNLKVYNVNIVLLFMIKFNKIKIANRWIWILFRTNVYDMYHGLTDAVPDIYINNKLILIYLF